MRLNTILIVILSLTRGVAPAQSEHQFGPGQTTTLPEPHATKSKMNFSKVQGFRNGSTPKAPPEFSVMKFADGLENPRWTYVTSNGDVLVAEANTHHSIWEKIGAPIVGASRSNSMRKSADRITLLRDADHDGLPETRSIFLTGLNQPFGMLVMDQWLYVANTDALWRFPYKEGDLKIVSKGEKILDLPAGKHNRHWTRNIIANKDHSKIYIAVGSGSNVAENGVLNEMLRADILEINPDGSDMKVYAAGLRNPVGMGWAPGTNKLWTVVNERDLLGDDLVPDYLTSVKRDGFYGWPYEYFGDHPDGRVKDKKPVGLGESIVPDVALGSHTASLGLLFYTGKQFPEHYRGGAFIAQHGSWNRSTISGYKIVYVPFHNGEPAGDPEEFISFIADLRKDKVYGRPVGITQMPDGSIIITDDVNNTIWSVQGGSGKVVSKR